MAEGNRGRGTTPSQDPSAEKTALEPKGEVRVRYTPTPPDPDQANQIHPRRPLPLVPEKAPSPTSQEDPEPPPEH